MFINHSPLTDNIRNAIKASGCSLAQWVDKWMDALARRDAIIPSYFTCVFENDVPVTRSSHILTIQLPEAKTTKLELPDTYSPPVATHVWKILVPPSLDRWQQYCRTHIDLYAVLVPAFSGIDVPMILTKEEETSIGKLCLHCPSDIVLYSYLTVDMPRE